MVNAVQNGTSQQTLRPSRRAARQEKAISKIQKLERMLDRTGIRPVLEMQERLESYGRVYEQAYFTVSLREESLPSTLHFVLGWQQAKVIADLERSLEALRRYMLSIPSPNPLSPLELQAREAWERFDEGDPEPLDTFIKERLGIMANHDGPLPDALRRRVLKFLDFCFAPQPLYQPGDWFLLGQAANDQLTTLVGERIWMFPDLKAALSDDPNKTYKERLAEELPGVVREAWADIQTVSSTTLLNKASNSIRMMKPQGHQVLPDDVPDDSLARFEAQESIRQNLDTLEQEAGFSPQQLEVWRLSREGMEIAEIADTLGISPNQVSVQKHYAIVKAREVLGADGPIIF
jgi:DNA-binding CsgD family transcriptional regulator